MKRSRRDFWIHRLLLAVTGYQWRPRWDADGQIFMWLREESEAEIARRSTPNTGTDHG